ncbi:endoglucanase, partial [Verrucosispora sp. ts21]|uniref:cellulose binding domain-containing protein n=1 Tax=Verrucosispora sp. ts21 TaxID=2069341 RepID=UPI000CB13079
TTPPPTTPPPASTPPPGGSGCTVTFTPNTWTGGFTAEIRVTNRGSSLNSWTVTFNAGSGVQLSNGWNGVWSQSGDRITVRNADWNGSLFSGNTVSIGYQGTYSGSSLPAPSGFTLNGTNCT